MDSRPLVALTVGDPAGIGPEITAAAVTDRSLTAEVRLLAIGPDGVRPASVPRLAPEEPVALPPSQDVAWLPSSAPDRWEVGRVQAAGGRAAIEALRLGVRLAEEGVVDALVTGPVSKEAMHVAGEPVEGQTELLARWANGGAGAERCQMMAVGGNLRVLLLTRHMPLSEALAHVTHGRVLDHLSLLGETLEAWGMRSPRLALAGLNPHAGEHGLLGSEEDEILRPAVRTARDRGLDVRGPLGPDTVFARAAGGEFDGVLALYHDQAFIPVKLLAPRTGVTVLCGLPYLRVSPVHGTAFEIAGRGVASPENLIAAIRQAGQWALQRGTERPRGAPTGVRSPV